MVKKQVRARFAVNGPAPMNGSINAGTGSLEAYREGRKAAEAGRSKEVCLLTGIDAFRWGQGYDSIAVSA